MISRKVMNADFFVISRIYKNAIQHMINNNIFQWDDIYPSEDILRSDIAKEQLYAGIVDDAISSVFVLNQEFDEEYKCGQWQYPQSSYAVVHRLCVNTVFQNKGVGTQTMVLIEDITRGKGIESIRLDAFSQNPVALHMYEKLGYNKVGSVNFRKGLFYLFEKKL